MDEEEDSIVQEIPVYLSQTLSKELYVFQYPLRSAKEGWENAAVLNSRIKPVHQEVKLEFGLDTDSDRYSTSKGEQIALNTDGVKPSHVLHKEKDKNAYFKSGIMDKLQYASNTPVTDASKYAVAILQDGEMHFTPLNGIVQLRPSYSYFDKENKRLKEEEHEKSGAEEEAGGSGGAGSSMEPEAKQVTVTFARTESDRIKMAREKSFGYLAKKSAEEPWCEATWWHSNSDKAELERLKLFAAANSGMSDMGLDLGAAEYLGALVPADEESRAALAPGQASDVINLNEIKKLPLPEQCKIILKDAKLVTVGWLSSVLGLRGPTLLSALSGAGRLVSKGRWAARSDLLYPSGSLSRASGLSHVLMCRARDYALYLFTQSDYVDRRKFTAAVKLPPEEVREILSSVAHIKPNKGWELLIPPDPEFGEKYPDIEQRQALLWEAMQRQFNEMLSGEPATPKRQRKKSQRDSFSSDNGGMPSPKVRSNSVSFSPRESFSDNESGGDSKKMAKNNFKGCKKTHSTGGGHSNFNSSDKRVS